MTLTPADVIRLSALGVAGDDMPAPQEIPDVTMLRIRLMRWRQEALEAREDHYRAACALERAENGIVALKAAVIAFAAVFVLAFSAHWIR